MKDAMRFVSKLLFYFLVGGLLVLNASYGLRFVGRLFPDEWVIQWASLLLFDGGALIWFIVFLFDAEGAGQRGTALLGTGLDLLGAFAIALTEVFTAGEAYLVNPELVATLKTTAIYVLVIWLVFNVLMVYIFHATNPKTAEEMRTRSIMDKITAQALEETDNRANEIAAVVSSKMSAVMERRVLAELQRASGVRLLDDGGEILEARYRDTEEVKPQPRRAWWSLGKKERTFYEPAQKTPARRSHKDRVHSRMASTAFAADATTPEQRSERIVPQRREKTVDCAGRHKHNCMMAYVGVYGVPSDWTVVDGKAYCPDCASRENFTNQRGA